jgi:hypothetical protein
VLISLLLIPYFQVKTQYFKIPTLNGAIEKKIAPKLDLTSWLNGTYQEGYEAYLNDNFGFHDLIIRLNNQINFYIFKKAKANGVVVGKENYLYEESYIKAYYGQDFIGQSEIRKRLKRVHYIQQRLARMDKQFIIVYAPGKGSYFPEYIPDRLKTKIQTTNYETYVKTSKDLGINHIDFHKYFRAQKHRSKYPLYPQYGIHWSKYGMYLAADSMVRYIENLAHIDMANFYYKQLRWAQPEDTDYDIALGMNILDTLKSFQMAYPNVLSEPNTNKAKPSVLVVADSFYWGLFNFGFSNVFDKSHFWYYNEEVYPDTYVSPKKTKQVLFSKEVKSHDIFIVLATDANLPKFGWGFIDRFYHYLKTNEH